MECRTVASRFCPGRVCPWDGKPSWMRSAKRPGVDGSPMKLSSLASSVPIPYCL